jgi:hypothetical protein
MQQLSTVVASIRTVGALEKCGALPPDSLSYSRMLAPVRDLERRRRWHEGALRALAGASVVFVDPDNGLQGPQDVRLRPHKFAHISELADYAKRGQSLVVYHHADRTAAANLQARRRLLELANGIGQDPIGAVVSHRGSCRFFLIAAAEDHRETLAIAAHAFAQRWAAHVELVE